MYIYYEISCVFLRLKENISLFIFFLTVLYSLVQVHTEIKIVKKTVYSKAIKDDNLMNFKANTNL